MEIQLNEMLEEKVQPYLRNIENGALPPPIVIQPQSQEKKVRLSSFWTACYLFLLVCMDILELLKMLEQTLN